jgi:hypothetical protein
MTGIGPWNAPTTAEASAKENENGAIWKEGSREGQKGRCMNEKRVR